MHTEQLVSFRFQNIDIEVECQICSTSIQFQDDGLLQCGHVFHISCLNKYISTEIRQNRPFIKCPMELCGQLISASVIPNFIDGEDQILYNQISMNKYIQDNLTFTLRCPSAGCSAVYQFSQNQNYFFCDYCLKEYCLLCRCEFHYQMTCAEYRENNTFGQNDKKFYEFIKGSTFKQCPKCKFWVQKSSGCCSLKCRCGIQFCYDCGGLTCPHGECSKKK